MSEATVAAIVRWLSLRAPGDRRPLEITFHGGEPLVPGAPFYRMALPRLSEGLWPRPVKFALQSNLWLLTDELCELFREYHVSIGTSLDGPETINDAQRGPGYFARTMAGIERARARGSTPGCICTFTTASARRADEVFDFFLREGLDFSIHAALAGLDAKSNGWALEPEAYGLLLGEMLDHYLGHLDRVRISTLDAMCRSVSAGQGGICTFGDCLGEYLAVDPDGWIYSCQRLAKCPEFRLGNVHACPSRQVLAAAPAWKLFAERQEQVRDRTVCGDCAFLDICRGGCPYNALVANGNFDHALRDPLCPAYARVFQDITDRALEQVFSEENLSTVVAEGPSQHGLLRKGDLLQIMRGSPGPREVAPQARQAVAAVALAVSASPAEAAGRLDRVGLVTDLARATQSITALRDQLRRRSSDLVNVYLHVTYACNLACDHCYALSHPGRAETMPVRTVARLMVDAARAGFAKAIITGGEPMAHPQREALLDALAAARPAIQPMRVVLRTNLAYPLTPALADKIACSVDQVVVSLDGDQATHDARRGQGAYARTLANLRTLRDAKPRAQIMLAATLTAAQMGGPVGEAVRALGKQLDIDVRFKPVLPLGRAAMQALAPESYSSPDEDSGEIVTQRLRVASTCGLGLNLYLAPDGACFPCYALTGAEHVLGNVLADGLDTVLAKNDAYRNVTVDSNDQCRACSLRYLCGGFCRAWGGQGDPDAPIGDCRTFHERARALLLSALDVLNVTVEQWSAAGLPLPNEPPMVK